MPDTPDLASQMKQRHSNRGAPVAPESVKKPAPLLIPTPSTLLNLACSDTTRGAFKPGTMVNIVGDSFSGKTLLALGIMAECTMLPAFDKYRMILDDVEFANNFDIRKMFGKRLFDRLESATGKKGKSSATVADFQDNLDKAINKGEPFFYFLDSFDALTSDEEVARVKAAAKARATGKEVKGTYGMEKAKGLGQLLRMDIRDIGAMESFLGIISQTRDNIDPMSFVKRRRNGGRALKFYASHELWLAAGMKIKRLEQTVGINCEVECSKNKITGKLRRCSFANYYGYGIDDVGSCIDWLVRIGFWKKSKNTIVTTFDVEATREKLIHRIEDDGLEGALKKAMRKAWQEQEDALILQRKQRYA